MKRPLSESLLVELRKAVGAKDRRHDAEIQKHTWQQNLALLLQHEGIIGYSGLILKWLEGMGIQLIETVEVGGKTLEPMDSRLGMWAFANGWDIYAEAGGKIIKLTVDNCRDLIVPSTRYYMEVSR